MTKGTLTTKDGSNTLKVVDVERAVTIDYWFATPVGDDHGQRSFSMSNWTFTEDKPTAYEVIKAMKPGTVFAGPAGGSTRYIRLDGDYYYSTYSHQVNKLDERSFVPTVEFREVEL